MFFLFKTWIIVKQMNYQHFNRELDRDGDNKSRTHMEEMCVN